MFEEPKGRFGVSSFKEHPSLLGEPECGSAGSITAGGALNQQCVFIQSLPSSGGSLKWLADLVAHGVGQTVTCIALSCGDAMDVKRYMARHEGSYLEQETVSELIRWLRLGEARLDVPPFRIACETRVLPIEPELEPLSGWLQQTWHAGR